MKLIGALTSPYVRKGRIVMAGASDALAGELEPIQAEDAMRVALRHMLDRINTGGRR